MPSTEFKTVDGNPKCQNLEKYKNPYKQEKGLSEWKGGKIWKWANKPIPIYTKLDDYLSNLIPIINCGHPHGVKKDYQNARSHVPWLKPIFPVTFCNT